MALGAGSLAPDRIMYAKFQAPASTLLAIAAAVSLGLPHVTLAADEQRLPLTVEQIRQFMDVFTAMKTGYVDPVDDKKLFGACLSGMASGIDPESAYLDADALKELTSSMDLAGVGLELGIEDGLIKVVAPIEDTPSHYAGILSGDLIIKIDDSPTKGMTLNDAVHRLRGKAGTPITLTISRKGETQPKTLTLTRRTIKVQSVKSQLLEPGYAYVRLTQFQESTGSSLVKRLQDLYSKGRVDGLILDLRNNPGGLLQSGVGVAATFLPAKSPVLSMDGRISESKRRYLAAPEDYLRGSLESDYLKNLPSGVKDVPMVVLVNHGSAAASEIVAGALQDHKRAVVLGSRTFGRASIQTILPLQGNAAIKVTTGHWYTPNGRSIQSVGIVPDVLVSDKQGDNTQIDAGDDQPLNQALALLKSQSLVNQSRHER